MRTIVVLVLVLTSGLCFTPVALGILFPVLVSAEIISCTDRNPGLCNRDVLYSGTSAIVDIGTPVVPPAGAGWVVIMAAGVHCDDGAEWGIPFSGCKWMINNTHAPETTNCVLKSTNSWELSPRSTCSTAAVWGHHTGASPGGECVLFGQIEEGNDQYLRTPMGIINAEVAAQGGNRYCIKPQPPGVSCSVSLPPTIDHGSLTAGTNDRKYIDGVVSCGGAPVATVVGGGRIVFASGVRTNITATMRSTGSLRVQSDMTVDSSATPGDYFASVVVVVSPN